MVRPKNLLMMSVTFSSVALFLSFSHFLSHFLGFVCEKKGFNSTNKNTSDYGKLEVLLRISLLHNVDETIKGTFNRQLTKTRRKKCLKIKNRQEFIVFERRTKWTTEWKDKKMVEQGWSENKNHRKKKRYGQIGTVHLLRQCAQKINIIDKQTERKSEREYLEKACVWSVPKRLHSESVGIYLMRPATFVISQKINKSGTPKEEKKHIK